MSRVPTWAELRLDAIELAKLQRECYRDVHDMLDHDVPELDRKLSILSNKKQRKEIARVATKKPQQETKKVLSAPKKDIKLAPINIRDYEHLRPLPMPLSYYLKLNRPNMVRDADRRVLYLKKKAERRRALAAEEALSLLDQLRISSRTSSNKRSTSSLRSSMVRTVSRNSMPQGYQVKYNFSEHEMKRLTAKIYNRLPEVKKQRNQEVSKHRKLQNYKNKLDYGRKLVENRRRGIINYPLKTHFDESSVMSSQEDESLTNSFDRSADGNGYEQYY